MGSQAFIARDYDVFAGLDVDKKSISVTFTDHQGSVKSRTTRGSITHSGDPRLRSKLIQASWSAIRQDGELLEFFRTVVKKHPRPLGPRVAIVAVAHKLCVRAAVVLMQQRPYEVREKVQSAPLTQEETVPQGTTRRRAVPGDKTS